MHHAEAILKHDMPQVADELDTVLAEAELPVSELVKGGGGETALTQRLRHRLSDDYNWKKHNFEIKKIIDGKERESISHEIDHIKTFNGWTIALEIEWNNKDPFYDRDLENFNRLHANGAISIGAIITRGTTFHDNMVDTIEKFALLKGINDIEKLSEYYTPTQRQITIINRAAETQGSFERGWALSFARDKFGEATTHWRKLEDRVNRGVGSPCPLLFIGLPIDIVTLDN